METPPTNQPDGGDYTGRPQSEEEAKQHIAGIRQELLNSGVFAIRNMESSIDILSGDLSQKPAQFLQELLQNADDNTYSDSVEPELKISFLSTALRFDTNELGFRHQDLQSICSIGQSTKKEAKNANGGQTNAKTETRIGEKGVGFKAVFSVASQVFIQSGHYSFLFDSDKPLGRIMPEWAAFPREQLPGWTSILLVLKPSVNKRQLADEISKIDTLKLLFFLKRLRAVQVRVEHSMRWLPDRKFALRRVDHEVIGDPGSNLTIRTLIPDHFSGYVLHRHLVRNMPAEPKRQGCTESEVVLAFPKYSPDLASQKKTAGAAFPGSHRIYAFLPVHNYGFKFTIQADFLLVASREEIKLGPEWNKRIKEAIPSAVIEAIPRIRAVPELRYRWPMFFPARQDQHDDFFGDVELKITEQVADAKWVESQSEAKDGESAVLRRPSELRLVPEEYATAMTTKKPVFLPQPLIPTEASLFAYPSFKYPIETWEGLATIGIDVLSEKDFLADLTNFVRKHATRFQSMPMTWHGRLAEILDRLAGQHEDQIAALPLIRTQHDDWVAAVDGPLVFAPESGDAASFDVAMPWGVIGSTVHPDFASNTTCKALLRKLGAGDRDPEAVCRAVYRAHIANKLNFENPAAVSLTDIIGHIKYLRGANWVRGPLDDAPFWVETEGGTRRPSMEVYLHSDLPLSASAVFRHHRDKVSFLHPAYSETFPTRDDQRWLVRTLGLSTIPRLVKPYGTLLDFEISPDFLFLIDELPAVEVLRLIETHWEHYRPWIEPKMKFEAFKWPSPAIRRLLRRGWRSSAVQNDTVALGTPHYRIRRKISSIPVPCQDGSLAPLSQTCLPRKDVMAVLDVPKPNWVDILLSRPDSSSEALLIEKKEPPKKTRRRDLGPVAASMRVMDVPDPESQKWDFLEHFGVAVAMEPCAITSALDRLRQCAGPDASKEHVAGLYRALEMAIERTKSRKLSDVKAFFYHKPLIFSTTPTSRWLTVKECVWDGPKVLKHTAVLRIDYGEFRNLFCTLLGVVSTASFETATAELEAELAECEDLVYLRGLLPTLVLENPGKHQLKEKVGKMAIFPLWAGQRTETRFARRGLGGALSQDNEWYIADGPGYLPSFETQLPLLAFDVSHLESIQQLLELMECDSRRLSCLVENELVSTTNVLCDRDHTNRLRKKWRHIARLIPPCHPYRRNIIDKLRNLLVYRADSLVISYRFKKPWCDDVVTGRPTSVGATLITNSASPENMDIYFCSNRVASGQLPTGVEFELARMCGIVKPLHQMHLCRILIIDDLKGLEEDMDMAGIPVDTVGPMPPVLDVDGNALFAMFGLGHGDKRQSSLAKWGSVPPGERAGIRHCGGKSKNRLRPLTVPVPSLNQRRRNEEALGVAEFSVNAFLARILGKEYDPLAHWTSPTRAEYGHKSFEGSDASVSSFTVRDTKGLLKAFLAQHDWSRTSTLVNDPTFHIAVVYIRELGDSEFRLDTEQVQKAELLLRNDRDVFVLALVTDLYTDPRVALILDPWLLYRGGMLSLTNHNQFTGFFERAVPALYVRCTGESPATPGPEADAEGFQYQSLKADEMRLLDISPGTGAEPIRGLIRHVAVGKAGTYWAVSYVWGQQGAIGADGESINGQQSQRYHVEIGSERVKIQTTPSLDAALRMLREKHCGKAAPLSVWVDAVCINQHDVHEKALQIPKMGSIFGEAERVVAWLGEEANESHEALEVLAKSRSTGAYAALYDKVNKLVRRPWFERAWIAQELVLATRVVLHCGQRSEVDWDVFYEGLKAYEARASMFLPDAGSALALGLTRQKWRDGSRHSLLELLELFSHTRATVEVDRFFSLLALAYDGREPYFRPDYDSSLQDVVWNFVRGFMDRGQIMDLIHRAGDGKSYSFSSWIPRLTRGDFPPTISTWHPTGEPFYAGRPCAASYHVLDGNPRRVRLRGHTFDEVRRTTTVVMVSEESSALYFQDTLEMFRKMLEPYGKGRYHTKEGLDELLLRIPIGDARGPSTEPTALSLSSTASSADQNGDEDTPSREKVWPKNLSDLVLRSAAATCDASNVDLTRYMLSLSEADRTTLTQYWQTAVAFARRLKNAVFCETKGMYVGLVPDGAKVGDRIVLLDGGKVPFLLRRAVIGTGARAANTWSLVGECYIHGIMRGEGLKGGLGEEDFILV